MLPAVNGNPGLHLHLSNRLELLADALALVLRHPLRRAFDPEAIVVQTAGMGGWLTQQLADRQRICANFSFLFPQRFVAELIQKALPERAAADFYTRENLTWRTMKLLRELVRQSEFAELQRYLAEARPELRRFQLAGKIAATFDRYLAFRPQMILDWEKGAEKHWQAVLWRELVRGASGLHPPALAEEFKAILRRGGAPLPERVSVFGISTLPPFYLGFLGELAQRTEVHFFLMRPTPDWWVDTCSEREATRARRKVPATAQLALQFESGNPLLASLGKLGREFLDKITELNPTREHENFQLPDEKAVLTQIQRDIFKLHDPASGARRFALADDRSLQFHSCHSPMREMEVLHDQLLALFEKFPDLKPHDIVVMAPDISVYAPFIEAVFATAPKELRIPFSISDRGARAENGVIDTFLRILELAESRFAAGEVLNLLESEALRDRFELAEPDLEIIRSWIAESGIRWGIDAAQRASFGLPAFEANSWRAGLDRLLLGYAAPGRDERLFEGILAYDNVEGSLAETLGHFAEFADVLFATARDLEQPRSLIDWQERLGRIVEDFFVADDEREPALRQLRYVMESLGESARISGFDEAIPLEVLIAHLAQSLTMTETGAGFLAGQVTFCALKPMRTVPFRIVCLVGMSDTAYPRHDRPPAFDLIAQRPRPGDRTTRDDDRYLLLEALLSARDVLYVSYVGQSSRDNKPLPPSVLVSELLHYTASSFDIAEEMLVTKHPLQPFSPAYFRENRALFSYSTENCAASEVAAGQRQTPPPFIIAPISEPEAEWRRLNLSKLISFFGHPAKFFINERLGLRLPRMDDLLEESEPLEVDQLPKYWVQQELLDHALRGEPLDLLLPLLRARGNLPPGSAGDAQLRELCENAEQFAALVRQHLADAPDPPREVELALDDFELTGRLYRLHSGRVVHYRLTTRKPKDLLTVWLEHLIANCKAATESNLITADKQNRPVLERFEPIEQEFAAENLRILLRGYWRGLHEPLPLFPRSSLEYVQQMLAPKGNRSPLEAAQAKWRRSPEPWEPDRGEKPEADDPYFRLAFRNVVDPLNENWQQLALEIFVPPVKAIRK
jgi:exodeoxyribonuclease V gamma subunit